MKKAKRLRLEGIALFGLLLVTAPLARADDEPRPIIIDNGDEGFTQSGFASRGDWSGHGADSAWEGPRSPGNFARYSPGLTGRYDVYLYWGGYGGLDTDALWTVQHTGGATTHGFDQHLTSGWHFHGTYRLDADSHVSLNPRKNQDAAIVADAVNFVPATTRTIDRVAKDTITPMTLNHGDELRFRLRNGETRTIKLIGTRAEVLDGDDQGRVRKYSFEADLEIDGARHVITRVNPAPESFYEPLVIGGMRVWLDAVSDLFIDDGGFLEEKDIKLGISCRPKRKARIVVNDVRDRICPEPLAWWYPETRDHLDIRECYTGENVWMGPYQGKSAHGGLDINMKSGTPLFAPMAIDRHYLFDSLLKGDNNNRWRGIRQWKDGSTWWLQAHHLNKMLLPDPGPLEAGAKYAETAGVLTGSREHTHFVFRIIEEGESYWVDPWLLFWQTFKDHRDADAGEE